MKTNHSALQGHLATGLAAMAASFEQIRELFPEEETQQRILTLIDKLDPAGRHSLWGTLLDELDKDWRIAATDEQIRSVGRRPYARLEGLTNSCGKHETPPDSEKKNVAASADNDKPRKG